MTSPPFKIGGLARTDVYRVVENTRIRMTRECRGCLKKEE